MASSTLTTTLRCSEGCGTTVAREFRGYACPTCGNLLEAVANPGPLTSAAQLQ